MSMIDEMVKMLAGHDVDGLAARIGITPQQVQSALDALGRSRAEPGDTASLAADKTGLPTDSMQQLLALIGGHEGLDRLVPLLGQDGGLAGLARGFFER
ncbi:MAG: hypothetical protein ACRYFW_04500 [Janthinobacterium lividum]